ncbi:MAG: hypothetical protein ACM31P_19640 [Actinomycetota bacterium]
MTKRAPYAALAAVVLYAALVGAIRGTDGDIPSATAINGLDQVLYFRYLDIQAYVQGNVPARWAVAFASTVAVECFVLGLMLKNHDFRVVARAGFLASLSTHPVFWYCLTGLRTDYAFWVVTLELAIAGVEAVVLSAVLEDVSVRRCLVLSLAANGASFLLGLLGISG